MTQSHDAGQVSPGPALVCCQETHFQRFWFAVSFKRGLQSLIFNSTQHIKPNHGESLYVRPVWRIVQITGTQFRPLDSVHIVESVQIIRTRFRSLGLGSVHQDSVQIIRTRFRLLGLGSVHQDSVQIIRVQFRSLGSDHSTGLYGRRSQ